MKVFRNGVVDLLPRWRGVTWTWRRILLLGIGVFCLVDSLFIPVSANVDPGRSSEGILFLILVFRAASKSELPTFVLVSGACLATLVASLNHRLLASSFFLDIAAILLLAIVMFWGRQKGQTVNRRNCEYYDTDSD